MRWQIGRMDGRTDRILLKCNSRALWVGMVTGMPLRLPVVYGVSCNWMLQGTCVWSEVLLGLARARGEGRKVSGVGELPVGG